MHKTSLLVTAFRHRARLVAGRSELRYRVIGILDWKRRFSENGPEDPNRPPPSTDSMPCGDRAAALSKCSTTCCNRNSPPAIKSRTQTSTGKRPHRLMRPPLYDQEECTPEALTNVRFGFRPHLKFSPSHVAPWYSFGENSQRRATYRQAKEQLSAYRLICEATSLHHDARES